MDLGGSENLAASHSLMRAQKNEKWDDRKLSALGRERT
jgi:hypothetical protein